MPTSTALITGASTGIGRELARIHAERGGDLVVVARREEKLLELKRELESAHGTTVHVFARDLTEPGAGSELHGAVTDAGIAVDVLVNNAGFGGSGPVHERPLDDDLAMVQLNVIALMELTHRFLPDFLRAGRGRILNVSSTASLFPGGPLQAVYFATKAFVTSFSHGLAEELRDSPVTVTTLLPGATDTEFAEVAGMDDTPLFARPSSPRAVAEAGYDAMMAGRLEVVSGISTMRRIQMALMPFAPKSFVLGQVRQAQEARG